MTKKIIRAIAVMLLLAFAVVPVASLAEITQFAMTSAYGSGDTKAADTVKVTLKVESLFLDDPGAQLLLDPTHMKYDPTAWRFWNKSANGDITPYYEKWANRIPDGTTTTDNVVKAGESKTIEIPVGTYDIYVAIPDSFGTTVNLAAESGYDGDNYTFAPDMDYTFTVTIKDAGEQATLTSAPASTTPVEPDDSELTLAISEATAATGRDFRVYVTSEIPEGDSVVWKLDGLTATQYGGPKSDATGTYYNINVDSTGEGTLTASLQKHPDVTAKCSVKIVEDTDIQLSSTVGDWQELTFPYEKELEFDAKTGKQYRVWRKGTGIRNNWFNANAFCYKFKADFDGEVVFTTSKVDKNVDTYIVVYDTDNCNQYVENGYDDESNGNGFSKLTLNVTNGKTYYVVVCQDTTGTTNSSPYADGINGKFTFKAEKVGAEEPDPKDVATVKLHVKALAGDDGAQLVLDSTAKNFDPSKTDNFWEYDSDVAEDDCYNGFDKHIPESDLTLENIVELYDTVEITVEPGEYDVYVLVPDSYGYEYVAIAKALNFSGDNLKLEAGHTYEFTTDTQVSGYSRINTVTLTDNGEEYKPAEPPKTEAPAAGFTLNTEEMTVPVGGSDRVYVTSEIPEGVEVLWEYTGGTGNELNDVNVVGNYCQVYGLQVCEMTVTAALSTNPSATKTCKVHFVAPEDMGPDKFGKWTTISAIPYSADCEFDAKNGGDSMMFVPGKNAEGANLAARYARVYGYEYTPDFTGRIEITTSAAASGDEEVDTYLSLFKGDTFELVGWDDASNDGKNYSKITADVEQGVKYYIVVSQDCGRNIFQVFYQGKFKFDVKKAGETTPNTEAPKTQAPTTQAPNTETPATQKPAETPMPGGSPDKATVILTVEDIFKYMDKGAVFLFDSTAKAYTEEVASTGIFWDMVEDGEGTLGERYKPFDITVPANLTGDFNKDSYIVNQSVSIELEPGLYDFYSVLPSTKTTFLKSVGLCGGNGGALNDYNFQAGKTYHFTVKYRNNYEGDTYVICTLEVTDGTSTPVPTQEPTQKPDTTPEPTEWTTILVSADDIWYGTAGYVMLLDSDHNTYGEDNIIKPGWLGFWANGDIPEGRFNQFEFKIPENATNELDSPNVIMGNSAYIKIPAGKYDYAFINKHADIGMTYVASNSGPALGTADDFEFEPNKTYHFHLYADYSSDSTAVRLTILDGTVTEPPVTEAPTPGPTATPVPTVAPGTTIKWDFDTEESLTGWSVIDYDQDGYKWSVYDVPEFALSGTRFAMSESWISTVGALEPDNWLITPAFQGGGDIVFYISAIDAAALGDGIGVFVSTDGGSDWGEEIEYFTATSTEYELCYIDLSAYAGKTVNVAFRHYKVTDLHGIAIDSVEATIGSGQPPVTEPPVTEEPPVTQAPATEPPVTEEPAIPGDADGNGIVEVADALKIMRHAIGVALLPDEVVVTCDMNEDGKLEVADALTVARMAMDLLN